KTFVPMHRCGGQLGPPCLRFLRSLLSEIPISSKNCLRLHRSPVGFINTSVGLWPVAGRSRFLRLALRCGGGAFDRSMARETRDDCYSSVGVGEVVSVPREMSRTPQPNPLRLLRFGIRGGAWPNRGVTASVPVCGRLRAAACSGTTP